MFGSDRCCLEDVMVLDCFFVGLVFRWWSNNFYFRGEATILFYLVETSSPVSECEFSLSVRVVGMLAKKVLCCCQECSP